MNKAYNPITWQNKPSTASPINATNLNAISQGLDTVDDRVIVLDNDKVSKEAGKGLSSNDYTTAEKTKLAGIATGATAVSISDTLQDGDTIANITIDGTTTAIKAKQPNEQEMNVRSAMLLLSPTPIDENSPFVKRISGGNVPFPALLKDKIIGASVVWNQLVKNGNFADTSIWATNGCTVSVSDNVLTATPSADNSRIEQPNFTIIKGHKYMISAQFKCASGKAKIAWYGAGITETNMNDSFVTVQAIYNNTYDDNTNWKVYYAVDGNTNRDTWQIKNAYITDLTAMFGSTIADYVYTLESGTSGSGIAWLKSYGFFTEDYYAYSANTIQSVSVSAKVNKDSEDTTISTVALDHTTLRGLFKLDANNNLYADGDIYPSDGNGSVVMQEVDLGNYTWVYQSGSSINTPYFQVTNIGIEGSSQVLCPMYDNIVPTNSNSDDMAMGVTSGGILRVRNTSYTSASDFKTAMSGVKAIFKKSTPTTQTLTPYPELQNIASGGTEEFIDYQVSQGNRDVSIPVGGERQYYQGMEIPNLPTTAGNHNLQYNPSTGFSWS